MKLSEENRGSGAQIHEARRIDTKNGTREARNELK